MSRARTRKIFLLPYRLSPIPGPLPGHGDPVSVKRPTRRGSYGLRCRSEIGVSELSFTALALPRRAPGLAASARLVFFASPGTDAHTIRCGTSLCQLEQTPDTGRQGPAGSQRASGGEGKRLDEAAGMEPPNIFIVGEAASDSTLDEPTRGETFGIHLGNASARG